MGVCVTLLIATYLFLAINVYPPTDLTRKRGLENKICQKVFIPCNGLWYILPISSLITAMQLVGLGYLLPCARDFVDPRHWATLSEEVRGRIATSITRGAVLSLVWCAFLLYELGFTLGIHMYVMLFLPHQITIIQTVAVSMVEAMFTRYCEILLEEFCDKLPRRDRCTHDVLDQDVQFWVDLTLEYEELAECVAQACKETEVTTFFRWLSLGFTIFGMVAAGLLSQEIKFSISCFVVFAFFLIKWCNEMWSKASLTAFSHDQYSTESLIGKARVYSKGPWLNPDAKLEYYNFLKHITFLPMGATGPVLGLVTKDALVKLGSSAVSCIPLLLAVRRFFHQ